MTGEWWACYICIYNFSFKVGGRKVSDSLIRLCAMVTLKISVITARSENGLINVWNLKTHRVDKALDGHGRKSVCWVETMDGKDRLLRLAKAKCSGNYSCFCYVPELQKKKQFLISGVCSTHTENVQKYQNPEKMKNQRWKKIYNWFL